LATQNTHKAHTKTKIPLFFKKKPSQFRIKLQAIPNYG